MYLTLQEVDLDNLQTCIDQGEYLRAWARNSTGEPQFLMRANFLPEKIRIHHGEFCVHGSLSLLGQNMQNEDSVLIGVGEAHNNFGPGLAIIKFEISHEKWESLMKPNT